MATNLEFIKSGTLITPTPYLEITDCFNSNYDVYQVVITKWTSSVASDDTRLRFIDNTNTKISTANYDNADIRLRSYSTTSQDKSVNTTWITTFGLDMRYTAENIGTVLYVYNPTDTSSYTFCQWQSSFFSRNGVEPIKGIGVLKLTTEITGLAFTSNAVNNLTEAQVSVYGVK
jgi:hypothetical protein